MQTKLNVKTKRKGIIVLAVGLPGSGKSTYFASRGIHALSSDTLRLWLLDDETNQQYQKWIFMALRYLLRLRLIIGRPQNYVDATNLTRQERRTYIRMADRYGYKVEAIFFDVTLDVCRARNLQRSRIVSEEAMEKLAAKLTPPSKDEGFARIVIVKA